MLLGRDSERLAIDRLLADARAGRSGVIALVGEPGIGKTSLLRHALGAASDMQVLRARGVESEAEVPFAGLSELLGPALAAIDRIPAPQAEALSGALALGPASAIDRFAIGAATLSLLSAYADDAPVLIAVDDVQLLDRSSGEALVFAFRRLIDDPVAVVLAAREGEPSLLDGADLRVLRVSGLGRADAATLLEGLPTDAIASVYRATGGNPLALQELADDPSALGVMEGPVDVPMPISASISAAFGRRLDRLSQPTRGLLLLAAAGDSRDVAVLARAAAAMQLDLASLTDAEEAGLIIVSEGEVSFVHPLVRAAVYAEATPAARREAHAALAAAVPAQDADRRAWHLAAATVGPDDAVSGELAAAGSRARGRSAYAEAAGAYERAGRLATSDEERGRLLYAAADAAWLSGDLGRTADLLDAAHLQTTDVRVRALIDQLRGHLLLRRGPVSDGYVLLAQGAERVAQADPELAVVMLAESVRGGLYAGATGEISAGARRAAEIAPAAASLRAEFFAEMATGIAMVWRGDAGGVVHARRAVEILQESDELREDPRLVTWAAIGPLWLREAGGGRDLIERASRQARAQGAAGALPEILQHLARDLATTDGWPQAEAILDESILLARESGQRSEYAAALAGLAWLQAHQGNAAACLRNAAEARELCAELGTGLYELWALQAMGDLELSLGHPAVSITHHLAQLETMRARKIADVDLSPAPELVDAYLRLDRRADAVEVAAAYAVAAGAKGQPWALARSARCRGMLEEGDGWVAAFDEAIELHGRTLEVFEEARTRLAYGARLRREGQRAASREQLRGALAIFERLGALAWAEGARTELAATGEKARKRDPSTLDDLTPQELQIARLLTSGMTTREAAAAAFLSPKTIEYHLRNTYRKLNIHTREELARVLGE